MYAIKKPALIIRAIYVYFNIILQSLSGERYLKHKNSKYDDEIYLN